MTRKNHRAGMSPEAIRQIKNYAFDALITANSIANLDGLIIEANTAFLQLWAYPNKQEVLGKPIPHFLNDPNEAAAIVTALDATGHWESDFTAKRMDGSTFTAHGLASVVRDENGQRIGYQSAVMDFTGRQQDDQALRESEAKYRKLNESIMDALVIVGMDGRIRESNRVYQEMLGYTAEELCRLSYVEITPEIWHGFEDRLVTERIIPLGDSGIYQKEYRRKDGTLIPVELRTFLLRDAKGNPTSMWAVVRDISGRRRAEAALLASEEQFHTLAMLAPVGIYLSDPAGNYLYANPAWCKMAGLGLEEALGQGWTQGIHPEDLSSVLKNWKRMAESRGQWAMEYRFQTREGKVSWVQGLATPQYDAAGHIVRYVGVNQNITERKQAEQALRDWNQALEHRVAKRAHDLQQSEARFRQLADAPFDGIAISEQGILIDGNTQLAQLHGYELSEMIGRPASDFIAPESRNLVAANMQTGTAMTYEFFGLRKDGAVFPIEARGRIGLWQGKPRRISALRDLSDIRQANAKLQTQQTELEQAQRLALAGEISAGIVHQIGQPLCAMGANVGAAMLRIQACDLKNSGTLEILKDVEADIGRLRDTVTQLRALTHPEQPTRLRRNFNELVEDLLCLIRQEAQSRQIALALELGDDLPLVLADAGQLSHAILNLVRNAFDACADCPPERRTVRITTRSLAGQDVELRVRDAGTGIRAEAMAGLFTPFFTTKPDGLGIGLRLSRTIVAAHGGRIEGLNNDDGIGATFRITLPAIPE